VSDFQQERNSLFTGLLLILLGSVLLFHRFHPDLEIGRIAERYWPVLLILWGIAKLIDHFASNKSGGHRPPFLSGREAALLVLVVLVLIAMWAAENFLPRGHRVHGFDVDILSRTYTENREVSPAQVPSGAKIRIETRRGNITVHAGEGNELRAEANLSAPGMSEGRAREMMKDIRVAIEKMATGYVLHAVGPGSDERTDVSFDVELPNKVSVSASSPRGDIAISGLAGSVVAESQSGDVEVHEIAGDVAVTIGNGDARISDVQGNARVSGKGNEVDVSDVTGDTAIEGDFFGPIRVRNVKKTTHFVSMSSDLTLLHLTGQLELDSGQIEISDVAGAAKLMTHNKDIEVENVAGRLDISGSRGDIKVRYSEPPREDVNIANNSGEVDLILPAKSAFEISAVSRSGEIESEFEDPALQPVNDKGTGRLNGKFGARGPKINIATTYGTIYLRRSS
jgi:putative adhesin/cell wall-active antibiotic response 4TMS protein YvqF